MERCLPRAQETSATNRLSTAQARQSDPPTEASGIRQASEAGSGLDRQGKRLDELQGVY